MNARSDPLKTIRLDDAKRDGPRVVNDCVFVRKTGPLTGDSDLWADVSPEQKVVAGSKGVRGISSHVTRDNIITAGDKQVSLRPCGTYLRCGEFAHYRASPTMWDVRCFRVQVGSSCL